MPRTTTTGQYATDRSCCPLLHVGVAVVREELRRMIQPDPEVPPATPPTTPPEEAPVEIDSASSPLMPTRCPTARLDDAVGALVEHPVIPPRPHADDVAVLYRLHDAVDAVENPKVGSA